MDFDLDVFFREEEEAAGGGRTDGGRRENRLLERAGAFCFCLREEYGRRSSVGGFIKYTTHIYLRRPSSSSSSPVAIDGVGNVPQDAVRGRGEDGDD